MLHIVFEKKTCRLRDERDHEACLLREERDHEACYARRWITKPDHEACYTRRWITKPDHEACYARRGITKPDHEACYARRGNTKPDHAMRGITKPRRIAVNHLRMPVKLAPIQTTDGPSTLCEELVELHLVATTTNTCSSD